MKLAHILIADGAPLYRLGARIAFQRYLKPYHLYEADSLNKIEAALTIENKIELIILDSKLPGLRHLTQLKKLAALSKTAILITVENEEGTLLYGDSLFNTYGVLSKKSTMYEFVRATQNILDGGTYWPQASGRELITQRTSTCSVEALTKSESRLLPMLKKGLMNKEIAARINRSEGTVKIHLSNIYRKLNIRNRTELAIALNEVIN